MSFPNARGVRIFGPLLALSLEIFGPLTIFTAAVLLLISLLPDYLRAHIAQLCVSSITV